MLPPRHLGYGLHYDTEFIERYAALGDDPMSFEDATKELVLRGIERVQPENVGRDQPTLIAALVESIARIGDNMGRMASSLEAFAKQAPLMTPPIGVEKVAELAGVAAKTVYRWKGQGLLKPLADNRPLLFDQAEVHDFLGRRRPQRREK